MTRTILGFLFFLLFIFGLFWAYYFAENFIGGGGSSFAKRSATTTNTNNQAVVSPGLGLEEESRQLYVSAQNWLEVKEDQDMAVSELEKSINAVDKIESEYPEYYRDKNIGSWEEYLRRTLSRWKSNSSRSNDDQTTNSETLVESSTIIKQQEQPEKKTSTRFNLGKLFGNRKSQATAGSNLPPINEVEVVEEVVVVDEPQLTSSSETSTSEPETTQKLSISEQEAEGDQPPAPNTEQKDAFSSVVIRDQPSIEVNPPPPLMNTSRESSEVDSLVLTDETESSFEVDSDDPPIMWFRGYLKSEAGKEYESEGNSEQALEKYRESKAWYDSLSQKHPDFQTDVVRRQREVLVRKISELRQLY